MDDGTHYLITRIVTSDQEPLLRESPQRFVLFPIQYPEVSHSPRHAYFSALTISISDMVFLQEGPGLFLDRRRNNPT